MVDNTPIVKAKPQELKSLMHSDAIRMKFAEALNSKQVGGFISNVLITVAENEALQRCTPVSIIAAALRAATMRLSVDLTSGQAYLVPFKDRCTLVVGYRGLIHLALRTGRYRYLNVGNVYQGEVVTEDRLTGLHSLQGPCTSKEIIGHLFYMEMTNSFKKTMYMSCSECEEHGRRHSRSYHLEKSVWKTDPHKMHAKTLIRLCITQYGYLEPADMQSLAADESLDEPLLLLPEVTPDPAPQLTADQAMKDLGFMD